MINVLLAVNNNQLDDFLNNWKHDDDGNRLNNSFSAYQTPLYEINPNLLTALHNTSQGLWKPNGANNTTVVTLYVVEVVEPDWSDPNDPEPKNILSVLKVMTDQFAGSLVILGAFKPDGLQHGITLIPATHNVDGVELTPETTEGEATYKVNPQVDLLPYIPDTVTYDVDGNILSVTPATQLADINLVSGWQPRVW